MRADADPAVFSAQSVDSVLAELNVSPAEGLDESRVASLRSRYGANVLEVTSSRRVAGIMVDQFKSLVVALLAAAGFTALLFGERPEAVAILIVIVINALIGFVTEWRAIRSMEALRGFARVTCKVLRESRVTEIAAADLVMGDIVLLDAGDLVPADLRLISQAKLTANESTLTGESIPVAKTTEAVPLPGTIFERRNSVFKGTTITRGRARGVVVAVGPGTEFGRIFDQVSSAEPQHTPLEKRLNRLGERLAVAVLLIAIAIGLGGVVAGREWVLAIEVAVALAVAAIPEGLPIVATIALARGMWRMAARNALVTRLSAVETLGATSVILTDKTGTLTENRMTVTDILLPDKEIALSTDERTGPEPALQCLLRTAALCNDASVRRCANDSTAAVGDPTEVALLDAAAAYGIWRDDLISSLPEVREDPFDPDSKRMATIHKHGEAYLVAVKGAPETIVSCCEFERHDDQHKPLTAEIRAQWSERIERLCEQGLRTLAIAGKSIPAPDADPYDKLVLHGVVGLEDPARAGVGEAITSCHNAGISVVMVTGDHAKTAKSIAEDVAIVQSGEDTGRFLCGEDVTRFLSDSRQSELFYARVFTRVTPEQKLKLIELYQGNDNVVAMTGDGVNDAPALKQADIGVAMGLRGTAVAKEAAAMVLQDDNFSTIVAAIEHGRAIFENIRKFVVYLLSCNISEVLVVALATLAGAPLPLLPLQILFLNLVTDIFPALALGVGPGRADAMSFPPRSPGEQILTRLQWVEILLYGLAMALIVLATMAIGKLYLNLAYQQSVTVAFYTLALAQLWHVFNLRSREAGLFVNEITRNLWIWLALGLCLLLIVGAFVIAPVRDVLRLADPGGAGWLLATVASLMILLVVPVLKAASDRFAGRVAK